MREKPYFPSPGISWKALKDQVNIIFQSTFWLKKGRISHHQKVKNKNFSVTSKYHFSINFLTQKKDRISYHRKVQNKNVSVISNYHLSINFLALKKTVFPIPKKIKARTIQSSVNIIFPSTFWLKNTIFFTSKKFKTRTF